VYIAVTIVNVILRVCMNGGS